MENVCVENDNVNIFFHNIEHRFVSFKRNIKKIAHKNNIEFDEDIFMDTIVKCNATFTKQNPTNEDVDNYFWVAFKQNIYSNFSRNKFRNAVNFDDIDDKILDDDYNADIDEIIDLITNEVKNKFEQQIYDAWILHVCNNVSYQELEQNGYEGLNLHNEFRQIKRYITQKFVNKNKNLYRLLRENNFI